MDARRHRVHPDLPIHASGSLLAASVELVDPVERLAPDSCALGKDSRVGELAPMGLPQRQSLAATRRGSR